MWDEVQIKYAATRICNKYKPWNCCKCPLAQWNVCNLGIMIDEVKKWANKNIPEEVIKNVSRKI